MGSRSWARGEDRLDLARAGGSVQLLRRLVIAAGLAWAIFFVVAEIRYGLELFGDGSIFSYSVAVEDAWRFHWHNIPGRLFVFAFCYATAEAYVHLTHDAAGGIAAYALLFSGAQLLGLMATWQADHSPNRLIFTYACGSTACVCPFVFGFPTEMWLAHACFWPALALCHGARRGLGGAFLVFAALLALAFTHEGALVLACAILVTLAMRGFRDFALRRGVALFGAVLAIWAAVKIMLPPDSYIVDVMHRAAFDFIDVRHLWASDLFRLVVAAVAGYAIMIAMLRALHVCDAHWFAAATVIIALAAYWVEYDHSLHGPNRYNLRTVLLIAIPLVGALAATYSLEAEQGLKLGLPLLGRVMRVLAAPAMLRAIAGALALIMLVHLVETAKFVTAWTDYTAGVRALATGETADPKLGDSRFIASDRLGPALNRLSWSSTIPFLSVLVAPGFSPSRLVMDPTANYFWLSCATALANEHADRAIPVESRHLIRVHACLHR
jgi:hypothetical protein